MCIHLNNGCDLNVTEPRTRIINLNAE